MLPEPLHPAVVHFPIVLALLAPVICAALVLAIRRRRAPARAWIAMLVLQAAVAGSAWLAVETGEGDEEKVERVVAESRIEEHEEAAERFLWLAALVLPLAAAGLAGGALGNGARVVTLVATLGVAWAVMDVGHKGGELVYRHGAASAWSDAATTPARTARHDD